MLKLSKLTDYAVVVLVRLSGMDGVQTSPGIAAATGIPEPTVAKVLKTLAASALVVSQRGARGGYRLNRALAAIPIADVIAAVDGPIALTACVEGSTTGCESQSLCPMRGAVGPGERCHPSCVIDDYLGRHAGPGDTGLSPACSGHPGCAPRGRRIGFSNGSRQ